jgi:LCP family protein required for cell wall assembly
MRRPSPFDPPPAATGLRTPARRTWVQWLIMSSGATLATICLLVSGFVAVQANRLASTARFDGSDLNLVDVADDQPQNWLVVGSDNREDTPGNRTDTIMIVRVDPEATGVNILSFQRDLWVPIAGTGKPAKINSAYGANDKPQNLSDTIKMNFNIDVNHYVEIDFRTFEGVVQAVDGVPMYFDRPVRDQGSGLFVYSPVAGEAPGCVAMDAGQALAFARSRHLQIQDSSGRWNSENRDDYGRISRQQYFMRRVFERAAAKAKDLRVLNDMVGTVNSFIKIDEKVDFDKVADMMKRFANFRGDSIKNWSLPTTPEKIQGQDVLVLKPEESVGTLNIFRGLDEHDADPRAVTFSILNGSGKTGQASQVQEAFRAIGYQAEVGGDASARLARTEVRHGFAGQELAAQIERHLTAGATIVADPTLPAGKVVLMTGEDLTTVMRRPRPWAPLIPAAPPGGEDPPASIAGATPTTKAPDTETTKPANTNTGDEVIGFVPGNVPPGVDCS